MKRGSIGSRPRPQAILLALYGFGLALSGCGTGSGDAPRPIAVQAQDLTAPTDKRAEEFKMYPAPNPNIDPGCDVFTLMSMSYTATGLHVTLQDQTTGACALGTVAKPREYDLHQIAAGCGSRGYAGTGIEMVDNRYRTCKDRVLSKIVLKEQPLGDFAGRTLYAL